MATIRKLRDRWQVQVRRKGYPAISKSFSLKSDALEWGRYTEQQIDRRTLPYDPRKLDIITLQAMLEKYRDEVVSAKRCIDRETNLLNAFITRSPKLVSLPLSAIHASQFCSYRDKRLKDVKPATVCRELGLIQHAYEIAINEWNYPLQENPLAKVSKPAINNRRERRLSFQELKALLKSMKCCQNRQMRLIVLLAIATGMRRSEMLAANWEHVNLNTRVLHIPMTKNGHDRTIPLSRVAIHILSDLKNQTGNGIKIFSLTEAAFRMAWRRGISRTGIIDLHFHDLRHEAISRFFEQGLSVPEVALISGHKDFRMLFRYTHLKAENLVCKLDKRAIPFTHNHEC